MQRFKSVINHTFFGASLLLFSITAANAALVWDNGTGDNSGAWTALADLQDDFGLSATTQLGSIDVFLLTDQAPPATFDGMFVNIDGFLASAAPTSWTSTLIATNPITGSGWGGYAIYIFPDTESRNQAVSNNKKMKSIEPFQWNH